MLSPPGFVRPSFPSRATAVALGVPFSKNANHRQKPKYFAIRTNVPGQRLGNGSLPNSKLATIRFDVVAAYGGEEALAQLSGWNTKRHSCRCSAELTAAEPRARMDPFVSIEISLWPGGGIWPGSGMGGGEQTERTVVGSNGKAAHTPLKAELSERRRSSERSH